jgi:hypothetical protein
LARVEWALSSHPLKPALRQRSAAWVETSCQEAYRPAGLYESSAVFVYGKEHDDVRAIDYVAIALLNVSATQALSTKVSDVESSDLHLRAENNALKQDVAALKTENATLMGMVLKMESLEKAVNTLQTKFEARPVALNQKSALIQPANRCSLSNVPQSSQ